jgi:large subunit ribosomal protein L24
MAPVINKSMVKKSVPPIKKNDEVYVIRGKDKGKSGRVLIVDPQKQRVVVEGVQMIKRHTRPNPQKNVKGGIVEKEASIHVSNVALVCKNCKQRTRIAKKVLEDGRRERTCKRCGNALD